MNFDEIKKNYSSGSLLKKKKCEGRTIKIEQLDPKTAERINNRVYASQKGRVPNNACEDGKIFRGRTKILKR